MRRVRCGECGKTYDFDVDDFCPRCGAFNQPPKTAAINADGRVIRIDGINEKNHAGSFVHEELHEENRARKRMGLSKGVKRAGTTAANPRFSGAQSAQSGRNRKNSPASAILIIFGLILGINFLNVLLRLLIFW